jgi:hypothetical protein
MNQVAPWFLAPLLLHEKHFQVEDNSYVFFSFEVPETDHYLLKLVDVIRSTR